MLNLFFPKSGTDINLQQLKLQSMSFKSRKQPVTNIIPSLVLRHNVTLKVKNNDKMT